MSLPVVTGDQTTTLAWFAEKAYDNSWTSEDLGGWYLMDGSDLGISNSLLLDGHYTYSNGSALVTAANFNGSDVLCIAFRGSDDAADWVTNLSDIDEHFELFQTLTDAAVSALEAGSYDAILVTGHSLGGAMTEVFMHAYSNENIFGISWGSPGIHQDEAISDDRLINYVFSDDGVAWLGGQRDDIADEVGLFSLGGFAEAAGALGLGFSFALVAALMDISGAYVHQGTTVLIGESGGYVGAFDSGITLDNFTPYVDTHDMTRYLATSFSLNDNPFTLPGATVAGSEMSDSEVTVMNLVDAIYGVLPDTGTMEAYSGYLDAGGSDDYAAAVLLAYSGLLDLSPGNFIDAVFTNIFGREATWAEEVALANTFPGASPSNLVAILADSAGQAAAMEPVISLAQALGTYDGV